MKDTLYYNEQHERQKVKREKDMKWYVYHDCNFVKMYILKEKHWKEVHGNDISVTGCKIQVADFQ